MLESQKLTLRASEIRQRLNEIAGLADDAVTPEIRGECDKLTEEYGTVETRTRAAIIAEDGERKAAETRGGAEDADAETRALRDLQGRASFGRFLRHFADGERLTGPEKELAEHRGLDDSPNRVPFDALLPPAGAGRAELRADAVTPAPATGNPTNQAEILQRVFARSATAALGVYMPSVGVGQASYPVINTGQSAAFVDADGVKEAAEGAIGPNVLLPRRLQARVQYRIEDEMTTAGLDSALTEDLRLSINDQLDKQLIGEGDAQVRGFLATAANGGLVAYADPTASVDFAAAAGQAARGVDGVFAGSEGECAMVIGTATYAKLASLIQDNDSTSATERLRRLLRTFMASANIPAAASNIQQGILAKLGGEGAGMSAVCPIWEGLKLIRDEVTNAAKGQIQITAVALHNFAIPRPSAFVRVKFKLA